VAFARLRFLQDFDLIDTFQIKGKGLSPSFDGSLLVLNLPSALGVKGKYL
jgi:hypothetical protein